MEYSAAELNLNLTSDLCTFLADLEFDDLPSYAAREASEGVLDYSGCALPGTDRSPITSDAALSKLCWRTNTGKRDR